MTTELFPTDSEGLPEAQRVTVVRLHDGDSDRPPHPCRAQAAGDDVLRMLAYNDSIPGPTCMLTRARISRSKCKTTATWRRPCTGTACASRTGTTACRSRRKHRSPSGATTPSSSSFPTPGMYWYHPHIREDYGLELGLYGTVVVEPSDPSYWAPADRLLDVDARRPSGRGPQDRALPAQRARPTRRWAASATSCS